MLKIHKLTSREIHDRLWSKVIGSAAAIFLVWASSVQAVPTLRLFSRVDPAELDAGVVRDIPIYLQERRAAADTSLFDPAEPAHTKGAEGLYRVRSTIQSTQSKLLDFIPSTDWINTTVTIANEDSISFHFTMQDGFTIGPGIPVTVDNVGIQGVTEIEIGRLRLEVGLPIDVTPDLVDETHILRLSLEFSDDPSGAHAVQRKNNNGGVQQLPSLAPTTFEVVEITPTDFLVVDFNGDGVVDAKDLTDETNGWEIRFGADLDGSHLLAWQREYSQVGAGNVATAPEPSTALLLALGIVATLCRRRFK